MTKPTASSRMEMRNRQMRRRDLGIQESIELQEMLNEERHFLILSAFDLKILRETVEKRMVW